MNYLATDQTELRHNLVLEIIPQSSASEVDVARSMEVLIEILSFSEVFNEAESRGKVLVSREQGRLYLLFLSDLTAPVLCALELCEVLRDFKSISVKMAVDSGRVSVEWDHSREITAVGPGIETIQNLVMACPPGGMLLSDNYAESLGRIDGWAGQIGTSKDELGLRRFQIDPQTVFILESMDVGRSDLAEALELAFAMDGHELAADRSEAKGVAWAKSVEARIRSADTVVAIVSPESVGSEMLKYQLEIAVDERRHRGRPQILPVWLDNNHGSDNAVAALEHNLHQSVWDRSENIEHVVSEVRAALVIGQAETDPETLEASGGAVAGNSQFYVRRTADDELEASLARHESILLVKGPRQIGKTSLIARGIDFVLSRNWRCATTDFQNLSSRQMESEGSCYRAVATTLARQTGFDFDFEEDWLDSLGPTRNLDGFIRDLLADSSTPLVWFIDEADRLFTSPFASEFFGIVRSWHNNRATDPHGPWGLLTVVIGYATEAHLFIKDLNRSPFNVGLQVNLETFTLDVMFDLNRRYGSPLARKADVEALYLLIGGQPFLTRRALDLVSGGKMSVGMLLATAHLDDGPFSDHLRRILVSVTQLPFVWDALVASLASPELPDSEGVLRLISGGILLRQSDGTLALRIELYRRFLAGYIAREAENRG